jgi:ABC-type nitrate/sulfonate/bicarbonate transport system substrate-binding protein
VTEAVVSAPSIAFKIGISEPVNTVLAIWMAEAAGLYAAEGLAVEVANMNGGSRGVAELAAGRLDAMHVGLSSVARLNRSGADLRIVAALANVIRFTFFVSSRIATAAQLKGGVVGVTTFGSESETVAELALARLGLVRADVTLKELGGSARRLAALMSGEIAATALNEPAAGLAREHGLRVLVDLVPERIPWLFTGIAVRRETIRDRGGPLTRFLKATAEGNALARSDAARGKAVLAKGTGIGDPKIVDIAYEDFRALSPPEIAPTPAAAENVLAQLSDASRDLADHIDTSILDGLRRDGAFAVLQEKYRR